MKSGKETCRTTAKAWTQGRCEGRFQLACTHLASGVVPGFVRLKKTDIFNLQAVEENLIKISIAASAGDPCTVLGQLIGKIDYSGDIFINLEKRKVSFKGAIGTVPAHEMYIQVDHGPILPIFTEPVAPGATLKDLIGPAKRQFNSGPVAF